MKNSHPLIPRAILRSIFIFLSIDDALLEEEDARAIDTEVRARQTLNKVESDSAFALPSNCARRGGNDVDFSERTRKLRIIRYTLSCFFFPPLA